MKFQKFNEIMKTLTVTDVKRLELKLQNELIEVMKRLRLSMAQ